MNEITGILGAIGNLLKADPIVMAIIMLCFALGMAFLTWIMVGVIKPILEQKYGYKFPTAWDKAQERIDKVINWILRRDK